MFCKKMDTFDNKVMNVRIWDEVENKVGAVVISHGMSEHTERYDDFAKFLNANGYVVLADDHRGHKFNSAGEKGMVEGDSFNQTVEDMHTVVEYAKTEYGVTDVILLGHSYGSFLSQRYLEVYSDSIKACVLSGTAFMKSSLVGMGRTIARIQCALCGPDKIGYLIDKMSFGAYNKPFEEQGQQFAWLSRDKEQVAKYEADEYCGYPLSLGFYKSFFNAIMTEMYMDGADKIRKDIPVLIACGGDDPVSNKSVLAKKLYDFYVGKGLTAVQLKIYPEARHEILNEINNKEVYNDILAFIKSC